MADEPPRRRGLRVTVSAPRLRSRVPARGLGPWLAGAAPPGARGEVGLALLSDAAVRRLNRTFRGVDRATDVLSFPSGPPAPGAWPTAGYARARAQGPTAFQDSHLGDIAIALGVARRQAAERCHSLATELRILALHGLLHLMGYDHEADQGRMLRVEERLRRRAGLPAGLIARGRAAR
jgi:probable rRNA maturation factor